jgi:hypothetical protein
LREREREREKRTHLLLLQVMEDLVRVHGDHLRVMSVLGVDVLVGEGSVEVRLRVSQALHIVGHVVVKVDQLRLRLDRVLRLERKQFLNLRCFLHFLLCNFQLRTSRL